MKPEKRVQLDQSVVLALVNGRLFMIEVVRLLLTRSLLITEGWGAFSTNSAQHNKADMQKADVHFVCSRIATGGVTEQQLASFHDQNGTNFKDAATAGGFPAKDLQVRPLSIHLAPLHIFRRLNKRLCSRNSRSVLQKLKHFFEHSFGFLNTDAVMQEYITNSQLDTSNVEAYVELHIEQGPLLENEAKEVGVVTGIFGAAMVHVQFNGSGGHGGGMPMEFRFCITF